jgi:type IV pilus assembly protein PilB
MLSLKERLIEILVNNKLITQEQLNEALEVQKKKGGRLSDIIVELSFIRESDLISALSEGLGFPLIDLKRFKVEPEVAKIIPAEIACAMAVNSCPWMTAAKVSLIGLKRCFLSFSSSGVIS